LFDGASGARVAGAGRAGDATARSWQVVPHAARRTAARRRSGIPDDRSPNRDPDVLPGAWPRLEGRARRAQGVRVTARRKP
jgi:hypothetical protein